jgi:hypothetical protein
VSDTFKNALGNSGSYASERRMCCQTRCAKQNPMYTIPSRYYIAGAASALCLELKRANAAGEKKKPSEACCNQLVVFLQTQEVFANLVDLAVATNYDDRLASIVLCLSPRFLHNVPSFYTIKAPISLFLLHSFLHSPMTQAHPCNNPTGPGLLSIPLDSSFSLTLSSSA